MIDGDLTVQLINATVQVEQPTADGRRTVGTGFLVSAPKLDGTPRVVLVTAAHVFERMPEREIRVGWRFSDPSGEWRYAPASVTIRDEAGIRWFRHPVEDVAILPIEAPESFTKAAIPLDWIADAETFEDYGVGPGDEMMTLGFPNGLASNRAGFPILRSGRVASYPLTPVKAFPVFLIDLTAVSGNSGGAVFMTHKSRRHPSTEQPAQVFIAGILTRQVEQDNNRLELGVVTQAVFVREAIAFMDEAGATPSPVAIQDKPTGR